MKEVLAKRKGLLLPSLAVSLDLLVNTEKDLIFTTTALFFTRTRRYSKKERLFMARQKTEKHEFQAEVRRLMDIVVNSLYTDREVFVRELVSNASDALEKLRYLQLTEKEISDPDLPLEIEITTSREDNTVTFTDYGIGMTRKELVENLGTIARSGSKEFLDAFDKGGAEDSGLIGQFGVGFYSCFMVADSVEVATRSYKENSEHLVWVSDGVGEFEISAGSGHRRGTKVVVSLKEDARQYSDQDTLQDILRKYSAFVPFPLRLNGEQINTADALWLRNKNEITDQEYGEFYRFQTNSFDEPRYRLHFASEAPVDMNVLMFVPEDNTERLGFGRMEPAVGLYSRRILIDPSPKKLLPEWTRFLKGVVDSADIPLNISRETMQDSALVKKLNSSIASRFVRFLEQNAEDDPKDYSEFYGRFGFFIKEGAASDPEHKEQLRGLLRFESSAAEKGELVSFSDYISRMPGEQEEIYYLFGHSREALEKGPHMEFFRTEKVEVLFIYEPIDEFVMSTIGEYEGKKIVSADSVDIAIASKDPQGSSEDEKSLCGWVKQVLGEKVGDVRIGGRLVESPAAAFNSDSSMTQGMKRIMKNLNPESDAARKVRLEINREHALIKNLMALRKKDEDLARTVTEQLFDNALLAAGYMDNPETMVGRINTLLERLSSDNSG